MIKSSIENPDWNPDLLSLDEHFQCLDQLSRDLQNGEINFYECNDKIEESLNRLNKLIVIYFSQLNHIYSLLLSF